VPKVELSPSELFDLLVAAAGQDRRRVRAITCRMRLKEPVQFDVELLGDPANIRRALHPPASDQGGIVSK
jgi:hypothetical protein